MKSKYKPYSSYKDSGVEWLGLLPESWEARRLGFYFSERREKVSDKDYPALSVTKKGIVPQLDSAAKTDDGDNRKKVCVGDFVINSRSDRKGSSGLSELTGSVSLINTIITPKSIDGKYTHNLLRSYPFQEEFYRYGKGIVADLWSTNYTSMKNILIPFQPLSEQQTIAHYLDSATAKIDTLIEKQTKLIALLKEKRQAVISTAVTRGLDSSVPMKDSGIEWLGKIPKHWRLPQVSRILILMEQGKSPECDSSKAELDEWGVLKTSCVNNAIYDSEKNKKLPSSIKPFTQYEVKEENILMSRASGSIDLIGSVAYVYKTRAKILLSDKIFRLYVDNSVNKIFFTYLMASDYMRTNIKMAISGGEGMANNIAKSSITRFKIALPPIEEQKIILIYIDKITTKIDNLITKSTKAIDLLKEKRTALVSSAVTGKIDVRKAS